MSAYLLYLPIQPHVVLYLTGVVTLSASHSIYQIERKRGITVKAQTASMLHQPEDKSTEPWLINLIDTPGADVIASCIGAPLRVPMPQRLCDSCGAQGTWISVTKSVVRWLLARGRCFSWTHHRVWH